MGAGGGRRAPPAAVPWLLAAALQLAAASRTAQISASGSDARAVWRARRPSAASLLLASTGVLRATGTGAPAESITEFDSDGDGFVSREEFVEGTMRVTDPTAQLSHHMREQFLEVFRFIDINRDDRLDSKEIATLHFLGNKSFHIASEVIFSVFAGLKFMGLDAPRLASVKELVHVMGQEMEPFMSRDDFLDMAERVLSRGRFHSLETGIMVEWLGGLFDTVDFNNDLLIAPTEGELMKMAANSWWQQQGLADVDPHRAEGAAEEAANVAIVDDTLEDLDADGDGRVALGEFLDAAAVADSDRAAYLFARADVDDDGHLDRAELARLLDIAYG